MRADTVSDEVEGVGRRAADLVQVVEQLGDAARAEARSPADLTEARLFHQRAVIHDDDVVLAPVEIRCRPTQKLFFFSANYLYFQVQARSKKMLLR